eukprot:8181227-Pyramimonas_sp.AAC.2
MDLLNGNNITLAKKVCRTCNFTAAPCRIPTQQKTVGVPADNADVVRGCLEFPRCETLIRNTSNLMCQLPSIDL